MRGERTHALTEAFTAYCADCIGADPTDDVRPRVLAGVLVGVESSVVELWGRSRVPLGEILDAAERSIPGLRVVAVCSTPLRGAVAHLHSAGGRLDCHEVTIF